MNKIFADITKCIGNTPIVRINAMSSGCHAEIYAKLEFMNPLSSVKDRAALFMIEDAIEKKLIGKNSTIIEPTSGNTGIALAYICAQRSMKAVLTMPDTMSNERKALLKMLGAELVLTDGKLGMKGAIDKAFELKNSIENSFIPMQFENPANIEAHKQTTAVEILESFENGVDIFVAGVGTGGTFSGVAAVLKNKNPETKAVVVEPFESPVISGGNAGAHKIQGIGAGFIPKNLKLDLIDEVVKVKSLDAIQTAHDAAIAEGLPLGISGGASLWAAIELAKDIKNKGKKILFIAPSCAERYISTPLGDLSK